MKYSKIKPVLVAIREEFVEHVAKNELSFPLDDLAGACGICSYLVWKTLKEMGYEPVFHMNDCHCFVTVGRYYIDLTLKQFFSNADDVFFRPHPYRYETQTWGCVHKKGKIATTEYGIEKLFSGWLDANNPFLQRKPLPEIHYGNISFNH